MIEIFAFFFFLKNNKLAFGPNILKSYTLVYHKLNSVKDSGIITFVCATAKRGCVRQNIGGIVFWEVVAQAQRAVRWAARGRRGTRRESAASSP